MLRNREANLLSIPLKKPRHGSPRLYGRRSMMVLAGEIKRQRKYVAAPHRLHQRLPANAARGDTCSADRRQHRHHTENDLETFGRGDQIGR